MIGDIFCRNFITNVVLTLSVMYNHLVWSVVFCRNRQSKVIARRGIRHAWYHNLWEVLAGDWIETRAKIRVLRMDDIVVAG